MKPTVGRQVHYYGKDTYWARNMALFREHCGGPSRVHERAWSLAKFAEGFRGPYAATVVCVHEDERVNLLICFPAPCIGTDRTVELIEGVAFSESGDGWTWPPRVP